jgi:hypothetical protein
MDASTSTLRPVLHIVAVGNRLVTLRLTAQSAEDEEDAMSDDEEDSVPSGSDGSVADGDSNASSAEDDDEWDDQGGLDERVSSAAFLVLL